MFAYFIVCSRSLSYESHTWKIIRISFRENFYENFQNQMLRYGYRVFVLFRPTIYSWPHKKRKLSFLLKVVSSPNGICQLFVSVSLCETKLLKTQWVHIGPSLFVFCISRFILSVFRFQCLDATVYTVNKVVQCSRCLGYLRPHDPRGWNVAVPALVLVYFLVFSFRDLYYRGQKIIIRQFIRHSNMTRVTGAVQCTADDEQKMASKRVGVGGRS